MSYQDLILEVLAGFKKMGSYHDVVEFKKSDFYRTIELMF